MNENTAAVTAREAAYVSLCRVTAEKRYSNLELDAGIKKYRLEGAEKKLYTLLVYGTIERMLTLDLVIDARLDAKNRRLDDNLRVLLRLGAYQLLYTDRIPDSAAVNESVELCRRSSRLGIKPNISGASGLVNAVLRGIIRDKGDLCADDYVVRLLDNAKISGTARLSIRHSVCEGLCRLWYEQYGEKKTEAILTSRRHDHIALRVNTLKMSVDEFIKRYDGMCELSPLSNVGVRWNGSAQAMLEAINDGDCFVEDESSQMTSAALGAVSGDKVLDSCAAPGGKTFSIAMFMENNGSILARDLHKNKLTLIEKGAKRLGLNIVEVKEADASKHEPELEGMFDRVLCDVPCSGSGVILKKPELRYKDPSEYERLPSVQTAILSVCSGYVRQGGTLVYSTCTLNRLENEEVVERFVENNSAFELVSMRTFFPDSDGTDGFFCAVLRRV